jgi:threonine/homoserine/homoserine lactone efflux protein
MAWSTLREHGALSVEEDAAPRSARTVLRDGVLINLLKPKLTIFFFAFLPQFVPAHGGATLHMLELSGAFVALGARLATTSR